MKNRITSILTSLSVLLLVVVTLMSQSCKKDETSSIAQITGKQISAGPWKVKLVTIDDADQSELFKNFTLEYSATTYVTTHGTEVWSAAGTWKFKDDTANVIVRDDAVEITIESITDTEFNFSLTWDQTTYGPGRTSGIAGVHKFYMVH